MRRGAGTAAAFAGLVFISLQASAAEVAVAVDPDQVLRGEFEQQRHLTGFDRPVISGGRFVVAGDRGVLWRTERPFRFDLVITPNGLLQVVPGKAPVQSMAAHSRGAEIFATFADILGSGHIDQAPHGFRVEEKPGPGRAWSRTLTPISGQLSAQLESITIYGSEFVDKVDVLRRNGDRDLLKFSRQSVSEAPLTADELELLSLATGIADSP